MSSSVMYIILNSSLKMKPGKLCSQTGHAAIESYRKSPKNSTFNNWNSSGSTKLVLRASEDVLYNLLSKYGKKNSNPKAFPIYDAGKTQVPEDSLTAIAFQIVEKGSVPEIKNLQLLN